MEHEVKEAEELAARVTREALLAKAAYDINYIIHCYSILKI